MWEMHFGVTVQTIEPALRSFSRECGSAPVRECTQIQVEPFRHRVDVMPRERRVIGSIPTPLATHPAFAHERELAFPPALLLRGIVLVAIIRVAIFADARAKAALAPPERISANHADVDYWHMVDNHNPKIRRWLRNASIGTMNQRAYSSTVRAGDSSKGAAGP